MNYELSQHLTLFQLNSMVRQVIEGVLTGTYWVEAELSEVREVRGHCYMELVEKDPLQPVPVARAQAKCWRQTWEPLRRRFEAATGQPLHAGMKVLLAVEANFHEAYGFAWIVRSIDPTFTLGDMARKRREIIAQLRAEGVLDLQRELALPLFAQSVAVISSEQAAGYGDFARQLMDNDRGLRFHITLFPAVMQGQQVEQSVIAALDAIAQREDEFDCVVIIRGGGATADMSGFDTLALAENVANFPLPIITGIGHDRDESVLDMVAHRRVKTPTAAAALLVDHLAATADHVAALGEHAAQCASHAIEVRRQRIDALAGRVPMLFSLVRTRQEGRLDALMQRASSSARQSVASARYRLAALWQRAAAGAATAATAEAHRLDRLALRLDALDPQRVLARGYSITTCQGRVVRSAADLRPGDRLATRLAHGMVLSTVDTEHNVNN